MQKWAHALHNSWKEAENLFFTHGLSAFIYTPKISFLRILLLIIYNWNPVYFLSKNKII